MTRPFDFNELLSHAVEANLNRLRVLAPEMRPADRQKLEIAVAKAFEDISQIASLTRTVRSTDVH